MNDLLLLALIASLEPTRGTPGEHMAVARAAVDACMDEGEWAGEECLYVLMAIAREESSLRVAPGRRWGCGAFQVQPGRPFRWRGVKVQTPRAGVLEQPIFAAKWALRVLETKWRWCRGDWFCAVRWYNGTAGGKAYARRVMRWVEKAR